MIVSGSQTTCHLVLTKAQHPTTVCYTKITNWTNSMRSKRMINMVFRNPALNYSSHGSGLTLGTRIATLGNITGLSPKALSPESTQT